MKSLFGAMLNINASKAFVIFPNDVMSRRSERQTRGHTFGELETCMSNACQQYADGRIARKDLVNSLVAYLEHDSH